MVVIDVCDHGPGFHEDAVHRGRSDRGSTGLGLDIARRYARASGGELTVLRERLDPLGAPHDPEWTIVRLRLGLASARPAQRAHSRI
jgi:signal transduction histidine kinase